MGALLKRITYPDFKLRHPDRMGALSKILAYQIEASKPPKEDDPNRIPLEVLYSMPENDARLTPSELRDLRAPGVWKSIGQKYLSYDIQEREQYIQFVRDFWATAYAQEYVTLADLHPWRVRLTYRIVREMARMKNLCNYDERLAQALCIRHEDGFDPYFHPTDPLPDRTQGYPHYYFEALMEAASLVPPYSIWWLNHDPATEKEFPVKTSQGVGLCPPPIPQPAIGWTEDNKPYVLNTYDPTDKAQDPALHLFLELVRGTIDFLNLGAGCDADPDQGWKGLTGLLDPAQVRLAWPTKTELLAWEHELVQQTCVSLVDFGIKKTYQWLEYEHGFSVLEMDGVVAMAKQYAKQITEKTLDEERGIMILRLEENVARAREALDHKGELNAMKQLGIVTGLTRAEVEDQMTEFLNIAKRVSAKAAEKATQKVLEASKNGELDYGK